MGRRMGELKGMSEKLSEYRMGAGPVPDRNRLWPLYGAGFENFGCDGAPIEVPMPQYSANELLVRHDAVGLCFGDFFLVISSCIRF